MKYFSMDQRWEDGSKSKEDRGQKLLIYFGKLAEE